MHYLPESGGRSSFLLLEVQTAQELKMVKEWWEMDKSQRAYLIAARLSQILLDSLEIHFPPVKG